MAVDWPLTLPQAPASFGERRGPNTIRTEPDSGPTKTRRRFTKSKRTAEMSFLLTIEQYAILDDFYVNQCLEGSVAMNFRHPWLLTIVQMHITAPPSHSNDGGLGVSVQMNVEYF